jgi:hypothetical protein
MSISITELIWGLAIAVLLAGSLAYIFWKQNKEVREAEKPKKRDEQAVNGTLQLRLQAYERLLLLADRIALPNLVSRLNAEGLGVKDMQSVFTQTIRQEFDHNITQQLYVSPEAWDAIRNLKEQNLLIVNQIASFLPSEASGTDLSRSLLELVMQNPKASLHTVVSEALTYEARKIMD